MSIEEIIRKIIREELASLGANPVADDEPTPAPAKASKKKASKKKPGRKPSAQAATPTPEPAAESEAQDAPTDYEGFMGQIKAAAQEQDDPTAAKMTAQDWLDENYSTRKFSDIAVEDYAEVLVGVFDVIAQ